MIEIKEVYSAQEATDAWNAKKLDNEIFNLVHRLEAKKIQYAELQAGCKHNHVTFASQQMRCEVCLKELQQ